ncbi:hypothetical protein F5Y10DRAFT_253830 [Nemania abortiva]|nr:hypothetical protein F5Y10DRAFT_253830 [Nemania abortiva]
MSSSITHLAHFLSSMLKSLLVVGAASREQGVLCQLLYLPLKRDPSSRNDAYKSLHSYCIEHRNLSYLSSYLD